MKGNRAALGMARANLTVIISLVLLLPLMLAGIMAPSLVLVSLAAVLLGIMTVPLIDARQIDWFSPWNWLFYATFLGVFLRSIYITFDIPDKSTIESVFLLGEPKEFLLRPMLVVMLGLCCTTFGYLAGPVISRKIPYRIFQSHDWSEQRLWFVLLVLLSLSWMGFYFFIAATVGQLGIENLAAHRGLSTELSEYQAFGYFRWMINLSDLACFLVVAKMTSIRRVRFRELVVFLLSLGTSVLYYIFAQARGGLFVIVTSLLAIGYYMHGRRFPIKTAIWLAPMALLTVRWMTGLRAGSGYERIDIEADGIFQTLINSIEPVIVNNGGIDVSKTAHIMAAMGKELDYQWGWTLINFAFLWVPRQLWPGKPTNVDTMIGMAVFGAKTYGAGAVPPGLIAELYWNFWVLGVIVGSFGIGYLLRVVYTHFRAYTNNRNVVILYVVSFMRLADAFMGSGFASGVMSFLMTFIPLFIVLNLLTDRIVARADNRSPYPGHETIIS